MENQKKSLEELKTELRLKREEKIEAEEKKKRGKLLNVFYGSIELAIGLMFFSLLIGMLLYISGEYDNKIYIARKYDKIESTLPDVKNNFYVLDTANVLSKEIKRDIINVNFYYKDKKQKPQVVVATVPKMNGLDIDEYAFKLFKKWEIGDSDLDNGILILVSIKERNIKIKVGNGLYYDITSDNTRDLIDRAIPYFYKGNYNEGIQYIFKNISNQINKKYNYTVDNLDYSLDYSKYECMDRKIPGKGAFLSWMGFVFVNSARIIKYIIVAYWIDGVFLGGWVFAIIEDTLKARAEYQRFM